MISAHQFGLFFAASLVLAIIPGPGMLYVAGRTIAGGRGEGVASSLGTGLGGLFHVAAASAGLSALILASAELFTALKVVGGLYLIWLGIRTVRAARAEIGASLRDLARPRPTSSRSAFREGVIVEATNPKTAAFFLALLPQFAAPEQGSLAMQFVLLGSVAVFLNTGMDLVVVLGAVRLRRAVGRRPHVLRRCREASGALFVALGAGVLLARRPAG